MSKINEVFDSMTPEERELFHKRMNEDSDPSRQLTYWFPEREHLESLTVTGPVPRRGDHVSVGSYGIHPEEGYDYKQRYRWRVKEVIWVIRANTTLKDRLLHSHHYSVEVYLGRDWVWEATTTLQFLPWRIQRWTKLFLKKLRVGFTSRSQTDGNT